mmetsp:Transcript_18767/g.52256  ORF Transcript_18767/g.52256 Transcript_18767/m.52256 type:complete len:722 (-) Transcript_18767:209-2374(-)
MALAARSTVLLFLSSLLTSVAQYTGPALSPAAYSLAFDAQEFQNQNVSDLAHVRIRFSYKEGYGYSFCTERDADFLQDPRLGTTILGPWGSSSRGISGISFPFFGKLYTSAYVGRHGAINLGWPEMEPSDHFAQPRISGFLSGYPSSRDPGSSGFLDGLSLTGSGSVVGQKLSDGDMVISYNDLQLARELCCDTSRVSFQVVLHTNGDISITYGDMRAGLLQSWWVGLSTGELSWKQADFLSPAALCGTTGSPPAGLTPSLPEGTSSPPAVPSLPPPVQGEQPPSPGPRDSEPRSALSSPEANGAEGSASKPLLLAPTETFSVGEGFDLEMRTVTFSFKEEVGYSSTVLSGALISPVGSMDSTNILGSSNSKAVTGITVTFFGETYNSAFVNRDGSITFGTPSSSGSPSLESHFSLPRISALYTGLAAVVGSSVSWRVLGSGGLVVTYLDVGPSGAASNQRSSFQITISPEGQIQVAYKEVHVESPIIVGLSAGGEIAKEETTDLFKADADDVSPGVTSGVDPFLIYAGVAVGGGLCIVLVLVAVCCCCRHQRRQQSKQRQPHDVEEGNQSSAVAAVAMSETSSCMNSSTYSGASAGPSAPPLPLSYQHLPAASLESQPQWMEFSAGPSTGKLHGKSVEEPLDPHPSAPPHPPEKWDNLPLDNEDDSNLCVWCLENTATHSFVPCGHRCVCAEHAELLCSKEGQRCPICRELITGSLRVYT